MNEGSPKTATDIYHIQIQLGMATGIVPLRTMSGTKLDKGKRHV